MKNERGFTLIEMLVVLLIITVLILITIPNVSKHFASIDKKGCDAYMLMVQGQVEAYKLEKRQYPSSATELYEAGYINSGELRCPDNSEITIGADGKVTGPANANNDNGSAG